MKRIAVLDSHTGGEPTRVVVDGGPDLGSGTVAEQAKRFAAMTVFQNIVTNEPRGSDILVSALLVPPSQAECVTGVIFFDNVGLLGMCGHGTIGLVVSLAHLGRIQPGVVKIETPVGIVTATLHDANCATIFNVPSFRYRKDVPVPGLDQHGDIAYGGNWFFIAACAETLDRRNAEQHTAYCWSIRQALEANGITGRDGALIDHIQLTGPPRDAKNSARNFVLCPGKAWDRSPCGTGTSARLACLAADGALKPGEIWRQESSMGSVFEGSFQPGPGDTILPAITGTAFVTAEATLLVDDADSLTVYALG